MEQQLTVFRAAETAQTAATMNPCAAPFLPPLPDLPVTLRPAGRFARRSRLPQEKFYQARLRYLVVQQIKSESSMSLGVFKAIHQATGRIVVEKRVSLEDQACKKRARAEVRAISQLKYHGAPSYINTFLEHFWHDQLEYVSMYLEFCDQGTVEDVERRFAMTDDLIPEPFAWHLLFGIANALAYCHDGILDAGTNPHRASPNQNKKWDAIIHNDIKPTNIFLTSEGQIGPFPRVVLGDFGSAVLASDLENGSENPAYQVLGTPTWLAPETDAGMCFPDPTDYGTYSDIWGIGAVVHAICHHMIQPKQSMAANGRPCGNLYTVELNDLVTRCMAFDPKDRPAAGEVAIEARIVMEKRGQYYS